MTYENSIEGIFVERPNRFIAHVIVNGQLEVCHVKNTSRCRELLYPGVTVYVEQSDNPNRKTKFSLIGVKKGNRLLNIDSQAPNKVVYEWLREGNLFPKANKIRPETKYGNSRFDFCIEENGKTIFMEVKGVTLEEDNVVRFPDAPTERGLKHVLELCDAVKNGYDAYICFVIQMEDVDYFTPNMKMHKEFGEALRKAKQCGVHILAYDCVVGENSLKIGKQVEVRIPEDEDLLDKISEPLLKWYDANARILPWRENSAPYRVWISEIMLQQTRVEAVKPYFERFIKALPTIGDLAEVEEDPLLKLWEGLGYYNRARNLKKAAQMIIQQFKGEFPSEYEELLNLPGVGSYTAGAISSIAFNKAVPAVDGNVLRVISRVTASEEDILKPEVKKHMEHVLLKVIPSERPGAFNQALMEIGAIVCVPNGSPKCEECPLNKICRANELGIAMELPKKTPKKARKIEEKTILVIRLGEKVAIRKRTEKGLLSGLYEFPNVDGHLTEEETLKLLKEMSFSPLRIQKLESAKHIFTHKEWHMIGYVIKIDELAPKSNRNEDYIFIDPAETEKEYPIPTAFLAYSKYMNMVLGNETFK